MKDITYTVPRANHYISKTKFYQTLVFERGLADFSISRSRKFNKCYVICNKKSFFIKELLVCIFAVVFIAGMIIVPPYSLAYIYKTLIAIIASVVFASFFMSIVIIMLRKMPFMPILTIDYTKSSLEIRRRRNIDIIQIKGDKFSISFSEIDSVKILKTTTFLQADGLTNWAANGYLKCFYINSRHENHLIFITTYGIVANKIIKLIGSIGDFTVTEEKRNYMERYAVERDTGIVDEHLLKRYSENPLTGKRLLVLLIIAVFVFMTLCFFFFF